MEEHKKAEPAATPASVWPKHVTLPKCGKIATIREGKGRDLAQVQKLCGRDTDKFLFHLIARLVTIDGNPIAAEHLDDMALPDVLALQKEVTDENFLPLVPETLPN